MSLDSPDVNVSHSGSRLLSLDPPTFPSDPSLSRTGPGEDDLSISELSLSDSILNKPFSLLAKFNPKPPPPPPTNHAEDLTTPTRIDVKNVAGPLETQNIVEEHEDEDHDRDAEVERADKEDEEVVRQRAQEKRDEKLKSDIFILKKLNAAFELFHDSLEETGSANEVG